MKPVALILLLLTLPLFLLAYLFLIFLWYPAAAILRIAKGDIPYPHEYMEAFVKGEILQAH